MKRKEGGRQRRKNEQQETADKLANMNLTWQEQSLRKEYVLG